MKWKCGVNTGETGNKMRFNGVDGFYSRVCAVIVRRGELMVDFVELEESFSRPPPAYA